MATAPRGRLRSGHCSLVSRIPHAQPEQRLCVYDPLWGAPTSQGSWGGLLPPKCAPQFFFHVLCAPSAIWYNLSNSSLQAPSDAASSTGALSESPSWKGGTSLPPPPSRPSLSLRPSQLCFIRVQEPLGLLNRLVFISSFSVPPGSAPSCL